MTDTTQRAEEIRETTGMAWEHACLQAERERDGQPGPNSDDLRAIYSAASQYLRALYADQPSPHATKDNAVRLARIAESLHHALPRA